MEQIGHAITVASFDDLDIEGDDRKVWLDLRRTGLGGSDVGKLAGVSRWGTPLSVWRSKVEAIDERSGSDAMVGRRREDFVAGEYELRTGHSINEPRALVRHPEHEWMLASIDRVRHPDQLIVEIKNRRYPWPDGPPLSEEFQCRHYMAVTGIEAVDLVVLFGGFDFEIYTIERDLEVEAALVELCGQFWRDHVETATPPPPAAGDSATLAAMYPGRIGTELTADAELVGLVQRKAELANRAKALKAQLDLVDAQLKARMGDAVELRTPEGTKLANWSASREVPDLDVAALAAAHPTIVAEFTGTKNTSRRLTLSPAGQDLATNPPEGQTE